MSWLLDMLIPAAALSALAAAGLLLLPKAPVRLRLMLALTGLGVWLVPWPWIRLPFALPPAAQTGLAPLTDVLAAIDPARAADLPAAPAGFVWLAAAAFAVGALLIAADWIALRASIAGWRSRSSTGEHLRALLPADFAATRAPIRVVASSRVAAAAGLLRPTIWIGDGFSEADARVALVHECWHVRRKDPLLIAAVMLARRLYWWNPIVAYLAAQAVLLVEAECDRRCVASLGACSYIERLAAMMLDHRERGAPRLAAAASGNQNVARLALLSEPARWRARDGAALLVLGALATGIAAWRVAELPPQPHAAPPAWSRVDIPGTPAGRALTALLDLDAWSSGVELVDIVRSEPLRIEYVVENRVDETRRRGILEVADGPGLRVTASAMGELAETP